MELYEQWLQRADDIGLQVLEKMPFESQAKGLVCGNCIGLNQNLETVEEKTCVLAEEIIHTERNVGNIIDQRIEDNAKQEHKARRILYHELADLKSIAKLLKKGYKHTHEIAEKLGVTEELLHDAIYNYREEYGTYLFIGDDILYLEPTLILKSRIKIN